MKRYPSLRVVVSAVLLLTGLSSCAVYDAPYQPAYGPPPPPPVVYYDYWYYPNVAVYYDINRHVYFYLSDSRWYQATILPPYLQAQLSVYVPIHSRYNYPYVEHHEHTRAYPPAYHHDHRPPERYEQPPPAPVKVPPVKVPPPRDYHEVPPAPPGYGQDRDDRHDNRSGDRRYPDQPGQGSHRDEHPPGSGQPQPRVLPGQETVIKKEPVRREMHEQPRKEPKSPSGSLPQQPPAQTGEGATGNGGKYHHKQPNEQENTSD